MTNRDKEIVKTTVIGAAVGAVAGTVRGYREATSVPGLVRTILSWTTQGAAIGRAVGKYQKENSYEGAATTGMIAGSVLFGTRTLSGIALTSAVGGRKGLKEHVDSKSESANDLAVASTAEMVSELASGTVLGAGVGLLAQRLSPKSKRA